LTLAALVVAVLHLGEVEQFAALLRGAQPQWLLLAIALQGATYVCAASVWHRTLAAAGGRVQLRSLVPLSLAKLFTDKAMPSGGLSGTMLLARGLTRRGIPSGLAVQTLLVTVVSFYAAYLGAALTAVLLLWLHHQANPYIVSAAAVFAAVAIAVPAAALSLKHWAHRKPPRWLDRLPGFRPAFEKIAAAPTDLLRRGGLLAQALLLQLGVILLDAATMWTVFLALGHPVGFAVVYVAFVMASVVATIGPIPLGLGTFEASSVGLLSLLGVDVEAALAATLLLRGLTFWLPMLPGLWLARREIGNAPGRDQ
jgi:uncharacterized membrane protein YbhN (UPF0104 family)